MLRTEEEAKTCWCPFARYMDGLNRTDDAAVGACIASACMAWRKADQIGITPEGKRVTRDMDGRTQWVDRGFCGLATTPEN